MARTVGIGIQSFEKLIMENSFYIDKTDFIRSKERQRVRQLQQWNWTMGYVRNTLI